MTINLTNFNPIILHRHGHFGNTSTGMPRLCLVIKGLVLLAAVLFLVGEATTVHAAPLPSKANLALNEPAVASSSRRNLFSASAVFDGNLSTYWASEFSDPQWVYVDMGANYTVDHVKLRWSSAYATAYKIQVSPDAVNWTDIYSTSAGKGGVEDLAGLKGAGRYLRVYGISRNSTHQYALYEVEVYGQSFGGSSFVTLPNPGTQHSLVGTNVSLPIKALDSMQKPLTYRATGLPPGLSINPSTGVIAGVTPNLATSYTVTVTASSSGDSATITFVWALATDDTTGNIALHKPSVASSTLKYSAAEVFDGDTSTYWASTFSDPQWVYVDLGTNYAINRIILRWGSKYATAYKIQVSADANTWTEIYSTTTGNGGKQDLTDLHGSGRFVRLYGTSRNSTFHYALYEMEVYGSGLPKVLESRNDWYRTGANTQETSLNTSNVNVNSFGLLYAYPVDGDVQAQPLYVPNVNTAVGTKNIVYVATMNDVVYALDADSNQTIWVRDFKDIAHGITAVPKSGVMDHGMRGVDGTPVIDATTQTLYLVVRTMVKSPGVKSTYVHRLHALDLSTGTDKINPTTVTASYNRAVFDPFQNAQRTGLALVAGQVVISWGRGDGGDFHGWIMSYDAATLQQTGVFATTITVNGGGGLWASGRAPAVTSDGHVVYFTGNGNGTTLDGYDGVNNFGETALRLDPSKGLAVVDWFTPDNWAYLDSKDIDLGGSGPTIMPQTGYIIGGGKEGVMYVIDPNNMGKLQTGNPQLLQSFRAVTPKLPTNWTHIMGGAVIWDRTAAGGGLTMYNWGESDYLKSYDFNGKTFDVANAKQGKYYIDQHPGGILSLSSNGAKAGTGIVWALGSQLGNTIQAAKQGILLAYDASDVSKPALWTSRMEDSDDSLAFARFTPPTIANGKVYVATFSNQLLVYGLLPTPRQQHNYVKLISRVGNKALEVAGASRLAGSRVQINQQSDLGRQVWVGNPLPSGAIQITSAFSGKVLDAGQGQTPGTKTQIWDANNADSQAWTAIPTDNGYVKLVSQQNQLALTVANATGSNGSPVLTNTLNPKDVKQDWKIVASTSEGGPMRSAGVTECDTTQMQIEINNASGGTKLFAGLSSDNVNVLMDVSRPGNSQIWSLYAPLEGDYWLQSTGNNLLLDIPDGGATEGGAVDTAHHSGSMSQHWQINLSKVGDPTVGLANIISPVAGKALTAGYMNRSGPVTVSQPAAAKASTQGWRLQDTNMRWCLP